MIAQSTLTEIVQIGMTSPIPLLDIPISAELMEGKLLSVTDVGQKLDDVPKRVALEGRLLSAEGLHRKLEAVRGAVPIDERSMSRRKNAYPVRNRAGYLFRGSRPVVLPVSRHSKGTPVRKSSAASNTRVQKAQEGHTKMQSLHQGMQCGQKKTAPNVGAHQSMQWDQKEENIQRDHDEAPVSFRDQKGKCIQNEASTFGYQKEHGIQNQASLKLGAYQATQGRNKVAAQIPAQHNTSLGNVSGSQNDDQHQAAPSQSATLAQMYLGAKVLQDGVGDGLMKTQRPHPNLEMSFYFDSPPDHEGAPRDRARSKATLNEQNASPSDGLIVTGGSGLPKGSKIAPFRATNRNPVITEFSLVMKHSNVVKCFLLTIPVCISDVCFPKESCDVILEDERGQKWITKYIVYKRSLSGGWRRLALDKGLKVGDKILFTRLDEKHFSIRLLK